MSTRSEHDTKVRLIRIDGHLPEGGYDVDHGGHEAEMSLGLASPRPLLRPPDRKQIGRAGRAPVATEGPRRRIRHRRHRQPRARTPNIVNTSGDSRVACTRIGSPSPVNIRGIPTYTPTCESIVACKQMVSRSVVQTLASCCGIPQGIRVIGRTMLDEAHQTIRSWIRQGSPQDGVSDAKDRGICSNAEREGQYCRTGESRGFPQSARRVPQITPGCVHAPLRVAEFTPRQATVTGRQVARDCQSQDSSPDRRQDGFDTATRIFTSWNQIREWLRRVESLRQAA
jgi:hypothetical protein